MTKVIFETATIQDAVKKAARIAPGKGVAFDKAAGIVLEIDPQATPPVVVRATNLDIFSMEWVDAVEAEGERRVWRIPSRPLEQVVSSLPIGSGKTVEIEEKVSGVSSVLHLSSGRTKARFNLLDHEYYPEWAAFDPDVCFSANDVGGRVAMVEWAAAKAGPPFTGVHFNGKEVIATDKYRLAVSALEIPDLKEPITVPAGLLGSILKQTGEISVAVEAGQLLIMPDEHTQIRTVVYGDKYPSVDKIMNRDFPQRIKVRKTSFMEVLQRVTNFAANDRIPTLRVFFGLEEIAMMMSNQEIGLLGDVVEVPGYCDHERHEIKFTPKNLVDAVNSVPNEEFEICYDPSGAGMRRVVYIDGGSGYEAWVMPRIDKENV